MSIPIGLMINRYFIFGKVALLHLNQLLKRIVLKWFCNEKRTSKVLCLLNLMHGVNVCRLNEKNDSECIY